MQDKYAFSLGSSSSEDDAIITKVVKNVKPVAQLNVNDAKSKKATKVGTFFKELIQESESSSEDEIFARKSDTKTVISLPQVSDTGLVKKDLTKTTIVLDM